MKFDSVRSFVNYSLENMVPCDIKIGDEFYTIKIWRMNRIDLRKISPDLVIDVVADGEFKRDRENSVAAQLNETNIDNVIKNNNYHYNIRKLGGGITAFEVVPKYEFDSKEQLIEEVEQIMDTICDINYK